MLGGEQLHEIYRRMHDYYLYISLRGNAFSPAQAEQQTGLQLSQKQEVGDLGITGPHRGKPLPYASARLVAPEVIPPHEHLLWLLDAGLSHIDTLRRLGLEDAEVWIVHYFHGGQANMEYTPEELEKLGRLGIPLCVSCYK